MKDLTQVESTDALGDVFIMTHSFFSDVIRIDCSFENPSDYVKNLSGKTLGDYKLEFSIHCKNPYEIKRQIQSHIQTQKYIDEFYSTSVKVAERLLKREVLVIPTLNSY